MSGRWVIVCGPSGAGKDSVIECARSALARHHRFRFARRLVTRSAYDASEHDYVPVEQMEELRTRGELAWHWRAHGFAYGVPIAYTRDVEAGRVVVVNGSRAHALSLGERDDVRCVLMTAPPEVLASRLRARGRDAMASVEDRLRRNELLPVPRVHCIISNDERIDSAGEALSTYLLGLVR